MWRRATGDATGAAYQGVERRSLGAVGHVVSIALGASVGTAVNPQGGGGVELVSGGSEQAALVHRAVHGGLGGGGRPRLCKRPAAGLAAGCQGVGTHQELDKKRAALREGVGGNGTITQTATKFSVVFFIRVHLWDVAPFPPLPYSISSAPEKRRSASS